MGMYLDVCVIYGVAWGADDVPSAAYPETADGMDQIEDGEPVYSGRLVWGSHGTTMGTPERHLAVCEAHGGPFQGRFAQRAGDSTLAQRVQWNTWIDDYLTSLGMKLEDIPTPGWLAIASFG